MKLRDYLKEERVEIEFTTGAEEIWVQKLAKKWSKKASWSFFTDAVIVDAPEPVMRKIRMEVSNATSKLKGLYVSEYTREGTLRGSVKYKEGDIIEYISIGGERRIVKIVNKEKNIKKGYPGFDGDEVDPKTFKLTGQTYWGYDDDITKVVKKK